MSVLKTRAVLFFFLAVIIKDAAGNDLPGLHPLSSGYPKTLEIIKDRGFIGEKHVIKDLGYPLTLYRIINPLADQTKLNKYPVLYGHGILLDAESMITQSENARPRKPIIGQPTINYGDPVDGSNDYSLPFMYSNNNFDVWLLDARETYANDRNTSVSSYTSKTQTFWDFSLDDQGLKDLPVIIDYVLAKTNSKKLVYTAFSATSLFAFELLSAKPEYADKFVAFVAMAPTAYVGHLRGSIVPILHSMTPSKLVLPDSIFLADLDIDDLKIGLGSLCSSHLFSNALCKAVVDSIGGDGSGEITPDFIAGFFKITSPKAVKHLEQMISSKKFCPFDYGTGENLERYGTPSPPDYNLSKIQTDRLIFFRGGQDIISSPEDQEQLLRELETKPYLDIYLPNYSHFDMITGKDLIRMINEPAMKAVYKLMQKDGPNYLKEASDQFIYTVESNEIATNESAKA